MPVTKKYKKGRNNRRKTRILLKKKFRRTRKKIVGGSGPIKYSVTKLADNMGSSKTVDLAIVDGNVVMTSDSTEYSTPITHNTMVTTDNTDELILKLNTKNAPEGRTVKFKASKTGDDTISQFKRDLTNDILKNSLSIDCNGAGADLIFWTNRKKMISICIETLPYDGLGDVLIVRQDESIGNSKMYYKYIYELKNDLTPKFNKDSTKHSLTIKNDYWGDINLEVPADSTKIHSLCEKINLSMKQTPSLETMIQIFAKKKMITNDSQDSQNLQNLTNNVANAKSAERLETTLKALAGVAIVAEFLDAGADSSNLPFIALATLGFSILVGSIKTVFEVQIQIQDTIQHISNIWTYIIGPLNEITKKEKKDNTKKLIDMEKLINNLNNKLAILLRSILIFKVNNNDEETVAQNIYKDKNITKWSNYDTSYLKTAEKLAGTVAGKVASPLTDTIGQAGSNTASFMGKAYRTNFLKKDLEEACDDIEEQLKLIMQVINLKTNYNTLELMKKTTELKQYAEETANRQRIKDLKKSDWGVVGVLKSKG
jgi:hypothetical protein